MSLYLHISQILFRFKSIIDSNSSRYKFVFAALLSVATQFNDTALTDQILVNKKFTSSLSFRYKLQPFQFLKQAKILFPPLKPFCLWLEEFEGYLGKRFDDQELLLKRKKFYEITSRLYGAIASITKALDVTFVPNPNEADLFQLWENAAISHVESTGDLCAILWIDDGFIEAQISNLEEDAVVITSKKGNLKERINQLSFLATARNSGRLSIVINSKEPVEIIEIISLSSFGTLPLRIFINKEKIFEKPHLQNKIENKIFTNKDKTQNFELILASELGYINFVKQSTLIWIGEKTIIKEIEQDLKMNGVNLVLLDQPSLAVLYIMDRQYLCKNKNFRIFVSFTEESKTDIENFIKTLRLGQSCSAPILVGINSLKQYDHSYSRFDFVQMTVSQTEIQTYGNMQPVSWAKPEMVMWDKKKPELGRVILTIHKISCENLYPRDSHNKRDPYVTLHVGEERVHKTIVIKDNIFPVWEKLDWVMDINYTDSLKFEVYDWDRIGKSTFEGMVSFHSVGDLCPILIQRKLQSYILTAQDPESKKSKKIRGTLTIEASLEIKQEIIPLHFRRPLSESLAQAEKSGSLHVTQLCICYLIRDHLLSEGLFRLPGCSPEIKALKQQIDNGLEINLDTEAVQNIASLYKLYFMELPSSLLPEQFYHQFRKCSLEQNTDTKLEMTIKLFDQISQDNKRVFIDLTSLLWEISKFSTQNFMDANNLAICFAPTVILPKNLSDDPNSLMETPTITSHLAWIVEHIDEVFPICSEPVASTPSLVDIAPLDKSIEEPPSPVDSPLLISMEIDIPPVGEVLDSSRERDDKKDKKITESDLPEITKSEEDGTKNTNRNKGRSRKYKLMFINKNDPQSPDKPHSKAEDSSLILSDRKRLNLIKVPEHEQDDKSDESEPNNDESVPPPPPPPQISKKRSNYIFSAANRSTSHLGTVHKTELKSKKTRLRLGKKKETKIDLKEAKDQLEKIISQLDENDMKLFCEHMMQLAKEELKELNQ